MKTPIKLPLLLSLIFQGLGPLSAQLQNPHNLEYHWSTDTSKHDVDLSELTVAARKDELHPMNFPVFVNKEDKHNHFFEHEPVIAISSNGRAKAYPLSLLNLFELSNDTFEGQNLMITYCPMCNAAVVFNRDVDINGTRKTLNFGISGILMHNDMVMYDQETNTWWEQLMGSGIVGELTGTTLEFMPSMLISVKDYFDRFPNGQILSSQGIRMTKHHHHRPFHHLEHDSSKLNAEFYLPEKTDPRLPPLERVLDIHIQDHVTIYPYHILSKNQVLNDSFDGVHFSIFFHGETVTVLDEDKLKSSKHVGSATAFRTKVDGQNLTFVKSGQYFQDEQTGSIWDITGYCREGAKKGKQLWLLPHSNHFAFAFLAFFPDCEIYGLGE